MYNVILESCNGTDGPQTDNILHSPALKIVGLTQPAGLNNPNPVHTNKDKYLN